ncbi:FMN-binding protein [Zhongshania aquimaris]|uniref:FMN-binding protein n=1 Tax=Zhongshania aquimaris TaxID=2857107 RepID=A0ABS6VVD1_9GAMM|nr:FMN-binding protein [Zhongshania aquimaris]MBW2942306.1 FMN-binding protein [Zhongshania aquimaris]
MLNQSERAGEAASIDAADFAPYRHLAVIALFAFVLMCSMTVVAFELYKTFQTPEVFLADVFKNDVPSPKLLVLNSASQREIASVFNRSFPQQRVRYWEDGDRTVWIFDDIGKEGYVPTTSGFVINNGVVDSAKVLIYRESRGEQVAEPSFLNQINGSKAAGKGLDKPVDNITGATLSVEMMKRMARTAITLDSLRSK